MTLNEHIAQLEAIRKEHGGDIEVVVEYDGGHRDFQQATVAPLIDDWYSGDLPNGAPVVVIG